MPSQFVAAQQREMAMRNARAARFLTVRRNDDETVRQYDFDPVIDHECVLTFCGGGIG